MLDDDGEEEEEEASALYVWCWQRRRDLGVNEMHVLYVVDV